MLGECEFLHLVEAPLKTLLLSLRLVKCYDRHGLRDVVNAADVVDLTILLLV